MRAALCLLAALASGPATWAQGTARTAPSYSAASIVNSASNLPGALAPYTIATLYGKNLSFSTRAAPAGDLRNSLPGVGVHVTVNNLTAGLYYVSPEQINFLIPNELQPGEVAIRVTRDGLVGDPVWIKLLEAASGLFQQDAATVLATHPDWTVVTPEQPAAPDGWVTLWAVGLGRTDPDVRGGEIAVGATPIRRRKDFRVLINGDPVEDSRIGYAGLAPGYAGLYQINLRLPDVLPSDPEIQIALGEQVSQSLRLPSRDRN